MKRLGSPSLIYILRTTSRYNINAPSSSKTKRLSAEAHLHTRYPKHCILVNDFTFQLKKIFQHYLQSIFSAPTRSPDGFLRHGALREIFSNVFRYTSPTLPEGIGSNSVENPRPSVCAIKMAPMFKIKKKKNKILIIVGVVVRFLLYVLVGMLSAVLTLLPQRSPNVHPSRCSRFDFLTPILLNRRSYRSSRWTLAARHT